MKNRAAFIESEKGSIVVRDAELSQPQGGEVLIKVYACAIQPADTKVAKLALFDLEYPSVLGSPVAGTVEVLGHSVRNFSIGERVASGTKVFVHKKAKYGGLQRYCVVDASEVINIGDMDFARAVTLCSYTPPAALFADSTLRLYRPTIPVSPLPPNEQGKKILIWGGSSAMGALSISYAKHAGYKVISTSSPHNFPLLKSCGAEFIFDHSDPETVTKIRDLFPIDYWFDTISLKPSLLTIFKILAPDGTSTDKTNILTLLPLSMTGITEIPDGITLQFHRFSTHAPENSEWHKHFVAPGGFMEKAIQRGSLQGVPAEVIGGLEKAVDGFEMVHKGVSGRKVVIEPWK